MYILHHDLSEKTSGIDVYVFKSVRDFAKYVAHMEEFDKHIDLVNGTVVGGIAALGAVIGLTPATAISAGIGVVAGLVRIGTIIAEPIKKALEEKSHMISHQTGIKPGNAHEWNWEGIKSQTGFSRWEDPCNWVVVTDSNNQKLLYEGPIQPGGRMGLSYHNGFMEGGILHVAGNTGDDDINQSNAYIVNTGRIIVGVNDKGIRLFQIDIGQLTTQRDWTGNLRVYEEEGSGAGETWIKGSRDDIVAKYKELRNRVGTSLYDNVKGTPGRAVKLWDRHNMAAYMAATKTPLMLDEYARHLWHPPKKVTLDNGIITSVDEW